MGCGSSKEQEITNPKKKGNVISNLLSLVDKMEDF
jgi:hypothetical protein